MESSLNVPMSMITGRVGNYLGYGYGVENGEKEWTDRQAIRVKDFADSGLRNFYFPQAPDGSVATYQWSFLRPTATLTLLGGTSSVDLPDDFGGIEGKVVVRASSQTIGYPVSVFNEGFLQEYINRFPSTTGIPCRCAIAPQKGTTAQRSPRAKLLFHPIPDADYTLTLQYYLIPEALTSANPWAYGGAMHAETIIESCIAVAELRLNDTIGVHDAAFKQRLSASMAMDRRLKAQDLGYAGDTSDERVIGRRYGAEQHYYSGTVLYNGGEY